MIKLNDQEKLAEDYVYFKKCKLFFLLSLFFVAAYLILILLIMSSILNSFFVFFAVMNSVLITLRSNQITTAKKIWDQRFII